MVYYRREPIPGSQVFLTLTLRDRKQDYLTRHIDDFRHAIRHARQRAPFDIIALCVLPEHLHLIMQLPPHDADFSHRVRLIKSHFSREVANKRGLLKNERGEYAIWQRRFWEHTVRNSADLQRCVDYVHFNPVKHGLVQAVKDWPYSSFHRAVRNGNLAADWGGESVAAEGMWGE